MNRTLDVTSYQTRIAILAALIVLALAACTPAATTPEVTVQPDEATEAPVAEASPTQEPTTAPTQAPATSTTAPTAAATGDAAAGASPTPAALAQAPTAAPTPTSLPGGGSARVYGFATDLAAPQLELVSPAASETVELGKSYRWAINAANSYIDVQYNAFRTSPATVGTGDTAGATGVLSIYVDEILAASITPTLGLNQTVRVPIPVEAVIEPTETLHTIRMTYTDRNTCQAGGRSGVTILGTSFVNMAYQELPLTVDLADFPRPVFDESIVAERVLVVIPDAYSGADLEAAASVAATIGRESFVGVPIIVRTAASVSDAELAQYSVIMIGTPDTNSRIADLYAQSLLPTVRTSTGIASGGTDVNPASGVVQEIVSPFNPDRAILVLTGASPQGVVRAARSLSAPAPRFGFAGNLVLVESVAPVAEPSTTQPLLATSELTLSDLGYSDAVFAGFGQQSTTLTFFVPANWVMLDSELELTYLSSSILDPNTSGLVIELNGKPVGSARVVSEGVETEQRTVITLPGEDIYPGEQNYLRILSNLQLPDECTVPDSNLVWARVRESSRLVLNHQERNFGVAGVVNDPFSALISASDLSDLAVVLNANPSTREVEAMLQIMWLLGDSSRGNTFSPRVFTGLTDQAALAGFNTLAVGLPSENPLIGLLNDDLLQPFDLTTNSLRQQVGNIVYDLPEGYSIGVVQAINAPWDTTRVVTVISGTTPEAMEWTQSALIDGDLRFELSSNLNYVRGTTVESVRVVGDSRGETVAAVQALAGEGSLDYLESTATPGPEPTPVIARPDYAPPPTALTPPLMIGAAVLVFIGVVIGVIGWRSNRKPEEETPDSSEQS